MNWFQAAEEYVRERRDAETAWQRSFTRRGWETLERASAYAHALGRNFVGVDHLLYGIVQPVEGLAARSLAAVGLSVDVVLAAFGRPASPSPWAPAPERLPFSPRLSQVVGRARIEATRLGHTAIDSEHLLICLLAERHGPVADLLRQRGVATAELARRIVAAAKPAIPRGD